MAEAYEHLPETSPNIVVYYDAVQFTATLASGAVVPIVNFLDLDGEVVLFDEINEHPSLRVLAGPTPDGNFVDFGISKDDADHARRMN